MQHSPLSTLSDVDRRAVLKTMMRRTYSKGEISRDEVLHVMAGGEDLPRIQMEIDMIDAVRKSTDGKTG